MNARAKGQRTQQRLVRFLLAHYPFSRIVPMYQVSRWAQAQPWDLCWFRPGKPITLVECRTGAWRLRAGSTQELSTLPGTGFGREVWCWSTTQRVWLRRYWDWAEQQWTRPVRVG